MQISVCEALKELKTLDARITKQTISGVFINYIVNGKLAAGQGELETFKTQAVASYNSIIALIERRNKIKAAIVESNAKTNVTIGGVLYTVAGAIERKKSIEYYQNLLDKIGIQFTETLRKIENINTKVQQTLDSHIAVILGKEAKDKGGEEVEAFTKNYLNKNEARIIDPIDVKDKKSVLEKDIEDFLDNIDIQLSISNATTLIEV